MTSHQRDTAADREQRRQALRALAAVLALSLPVLLTWWLLRGPGGARPPAPESPVPGPRPAADAVEREASPVLVGRERPPPPGPGRDLGDEGWPAILRRAPSTVPAPVAGRVLDEDGQPVAEVLLEVELARPGGGSARPPGALPVRTDARGRFRVPDAALPARVWAQPGPKHSASRSFTVAEPQGDPELGDLELRVGRERWVRGQVLAEDGAPAAQVNVEVAGGGFRASTMTDELGRFEVRTPPDVPRVRLQAGWSRWSGAGPTSPVLEVAGSSEGARLQLDASHVIEGRLLGPDGQPASGRLAAVPDPACEGLDDQAAADAGPDGAFRFGRLHGGAWAVVVVSVEQDARGLLPPEPVIVDAPRTGLRLVCREGAVVAGTVEAEFAEGLEVHVLPREGAENAPPGAGPVLGARTDGAGRFRVPGLTLDPRVLWVLDEARGRYARMDLREPRADLRVRLLAGLPTSGRLEGDLPRAARVQALQGVLAFHTPLRADGTFEFAGLPPGRWTLVWVPTSRTDWVSVRLVEVGGEAEIEAGARGAVLRPGGR